MIKISIPRGLGIEIITERAGYFYNRPYSPLDKERQTLASDEALAALRKKLTEPAPHRASDTLVDAYDICPDKCETCAPDLNLGRPMQLIDGAVQEQELNTVDHNPGRHLCYDDWSGRYFRGSMAFLAESVSRFNEIITAEGDAYLNDLYDILGLTPLPMGTNFGWSGSHLLISYDSLVSPSGEPCIVMSFRNEPKPDLGYYR